MIIFLSPIRHDQLDIIQACNAFLLGNAMSILYYLVLGSHVISLNCYKVRYEVPMFGQVNDIPELFLKGKMECVSSLYMQMCTPHVIDMNETYHSFF